MGLLSMLNPFGGGGSFSSGGIGNSTPTTTTQNTTTNTTTTTNNVDNSVRVTQTPEGAFALGESAINAAKSINADSIELLSSVVKGSIDSSNTLARESAAASDQAAQRAISGFEKLAVQSSASSDDRVQKVALYAVVGIALAVVLPSLFRSGGKVSFT